MVCESRPAEEEQHQPQTSHAHIEALLLSWHFWSIYIKSNHLYIISLDHVSNAIQVLGYFRLYFGFKYTYNYTHFWGGECLLFPNVCDSRQVQVPNSHKQHSQYSLSSARTRCIKIVLTSMYSRSICLIPPLGGQSGQQHN